MSARPSLSMRVARGRTGLGAVSRVAAVVAALLSGCGAARPQVPPEEPAPLRPAADLGPDVMYRQELVVHRAGHARRFEVVLQKRGDSLLLLALTALGTRAFTIELAGNAARFTDYTGGRVEPPFPPRVVVLDVERTLAPWLARPGGVLADGWHEGERDGERVRERWLGGRLFERSFRRLDGRPPGDVHVAFDGGAVPSGVPPPIRLRNERLGYELELRTLERHAL